MCGVVLFPMASCVRTELVCAPAPARDRSADIIALVGPPRLVPDSVAPTDRIVGRVLGQFQRRPIRGALLELDSIGTRTTTDSAGNFILAMPPLDHAVRHIRAIGYLMRRDSLRLASLAGHRLEVVLPDAYAFGDTKACRAFDSVAGGPSGLDRVPLGILTYARAVKGFSEAARGRILVDALATQPKRRGVHLLHLITQPMLHMVIVRHSPESCDRN